MKTTWKMTFLKTAPERTTHLSDKDFWNTIKTQLIVGSNIFHWRKYRWLSQQELAQKAKITQSIVSELEGWDYNPSLELIQKISTALDIDYELLYKKHIIWKMIEAIDYMASKLKMDTLKAMKLLFLIDYESQQKTENKIIWLEYRRWNRWPFNRDIYDAEALFGADKKEYKPMKFASYLVLEKEDKKFIDIIIEKFWHMSSLDLMEYTYRLEPMKGCTIWGNERMWEKIL